MALEGRATGFYEALKTKSTHADETTEIVDKLDHLIDEMQQALEIAILAVGEVEDSQLPVS